MTYEEMIKKTKIANHRCKPTNEEHKIQVSCVQWFRLKYPKLRHILFAIPNAGRRNVCNGSYMKREGLLAGVSDLIFLKSNRFYGALCIEMKTPAKNSIQSPEQKEWQKEIEAMGNKYVICRSLDDFMREVNNYINDI